jgi:serine/threonine-protein kinase
VADSDRSLENLAGLILDGQSIDWSAEDSGSADADRPIVGRLRQIAALAEVHRAHPPDTWGPLRRVGLWMELVDGRTLQQLAVDDDKPFSAGEVVRIGLQLCDAIAAVHDAGLLHRDIKAQNVMVSRDGRVVLMDFGAGRDRQDAGGGVTGTPLYLAPEVLTAGRSPSVQSDIYSAGVLLFFLLTKTHPVEGHDIDHLKTQHERGECVRLKTACPGLPQALYDAIDGALHPDPQRRHRNAAAFAAALRRADGGGAKRFTRQAVAAAIVVCSAAVWSSVPAGDRTQIAVLPFLNLTGVPGNEYLADGLTDEMIRNLATIGGLDVRAATSSFVFKGKPRNLADIGRRLGVDFVLDGSLTAGGDRFQVRAQLIRVAGEVPVWSETFERPRTVSDLLNARDAISRGVADRLRLTLGGGQRRYETALETYAMYLRARSLAERRGSVEPLQSVQLFQKVIDIDPTYAPAYAGLVLAYAYISMTPYQAIPFEKAHAIMRPAALEAIRRDPMLAEAQAARGWIHAREFEWAEAERCFRRALDLNPSLTVLATSFSFSTLRPLGRLAEAEQLLREAAHKDPLAPDVQRELAQVLLEASRPRESIEILEPLRVMDASMPFVELTLGRALVAVGRIDEATPLLERRRERLVDPASGPHPWVAAAWMQQDRRAEAEELARINDHLPFRRAIINAALGDAERMFSGLEEMARSEPQRLVLLLRQPEFSRYRSDARFVALLRKVKLL